MKRFAYIFIFSFLYITLCSKSCDQGERSEAAREQRGVESSIKNITVHFTADTLSHETLNGFEATAKTKVSDFFDYLNILSDQNTAPKFRSQVRKIISGLFISGDCTLAFDRFKGNKVEICSITQLVDSASVFPVYLKGLSADSLWIIIEIQAVGDSTYSGKIGFILQPVVMEKNMENIKIINGAIEYKVLRREKEFGGEKLKVWNVFLVNTEFKTKKR